MESALTSPNGLEQEADAAVTRRDLVTAEALLDRATRERPDRFVGWMKLAGIRRAIGKLPGALNAVHGALGLAPLDFTALLLRASLLEQIGQEDAAGEAYGRAMAQQPREGTDPRLEATMAHAVARHAAYTQRREKALSDAVSPLADGLNDDERVKLARFRSNVTRQTRPYHSEPTHFHYPGLPEREFHPRTQFTWLSAIEASTEAIAGELAQLLAAKGTQFEPYVQYAAHEPLDQWRALNHSRDWTAVHLLQNGKRVAANADACPLTMELLASVPQPVIAGCSPNAMFSLLAPQTTIPPHVGISNTRLVCHLPLIVPDGCWFRVGAETRSWHTGEGFVFDDTIEHEAANPTTDLRIVLIFDVWHYSLSGPEREAVRLLMEAEAVTTAL